jgi:hypothetical protein
VRKPPRTKTPKPKSEYESLVDRDLETRSPKNLQSQARLRKLSEFEMFSYSCWLMNVVVFIKG